MYWHLVAQSYTPTTDTATVSSENLNHDGD
jgi:hypothetical protein